MALEGGLRTRGEKKSPMPGRPLVSVITVVRNGAAHIEDTIMSVLGQTYENVEYIVVDGGSTDGTLDILRKYDSRIDYWASEPDRGISDAFNKGIALSSGEIVGTLNADDWYEAHAVERAVAALQAHGADVVAGAMQYWRGDKPAFLYYADPGALEKEMTVNHQSVFIRRPVLDRHGRFDERYRYAMDYELFLRLKLGGAAFHAVDDTLSNMRLEGRSDKGWFRAYREVLDIKDSLLGKRAGHRLYFLYMVVRKSMVVAFGWLGLDSAVASFKERFYMKSRPGSRKT